MPVVSPPPELLTEVAQGLLASAAALGAPPEVVATTTGALFGNGFVVPQDVFDHWFLTRGEAKVEAPSGSEVAEEAPAPVVAKKNGRGVRKPVVDGPEV